MLRVAMLMVLLAVFAVGCSSDPGRTETTSEFKGKATFADGKPVKDVRLNFFPTSSDQLPASVELKADGNFTIQLIPGKYTFAFEPNKSAAAFKAIPAAYHSNSADHPVEVKAGQDIDIQVK